MLPQSPQSGWESFPERDHDAFVYRLGNMVMLEAKANRSIGNASYEIKRSKLLESTFKLTRELAESNLEWTPESLVAHQNRLAKLATTTWKISQLS